MDKEIKLMNTKRTMAVGSILFALVDVVLAGAPALFDTVEPASGITENTWKKIGNGEMPGSFSGDAALVNAKLAALVKKDGSGIEIYASGPDGWKRWAKLSAVVGKDAAKLAGAKAETNDGEVVGVEVGVGDGAVLFRLSADPVLKVTRKGKVDALRVAAPCRLGVLPDFFGDDLLVDARRIPVARAEIPSDNFFLQMVGDGEAIVSAMWDKNERDIELTLSGDGERRLIASTDIFFGSGGTIAIAVLAQKGIWYSREMTREDGLNGVTFSDWDVPFSARWKGNFTREDNGTESMEFVLAGSTGTGRQRIKKKDGKLTAFLEPGGRDVDDSVPKPDSLKGYVGLSGVAVLYPINRASDTPPERLCLTDLMRMGLGTGPCESILDLDARTPACKGIFTCSYAGGWGKLMPRSAFGPFQQREDSAALKEERRYFEHMTQQTLIFVKHVQDRINDYVECGNELMKYLDEQEKKHPEQAAFIAKMRAEWATPVWQYPPVYPNHEKSTNEQIALADLAEFFKWLQIDTPEQMARGRTGAGRIPGRVGDPGDRRLRNLRRKIMVLRSIASMEMAMNPAAAEIAKEVRQRTEAALRNPAHYERVTVW